MKNTRHILLILTVFISIIHAANAQVHLICASDTIVLRAGNYQQGTIRWEKSVDMIDWQAISNEVDTVYKFIPVQTMYYRCVSKLSECPPEFSQITQVLLPPLANAGLDRIVPGTQVRLAANQEDGETGHWIIVSGNGGTLSDTTSPAAILQGQANETYTLVWFLSNPCGSSHDTVKVEFVSNQYFNNFVVVDTTDLILSTPSQLASGQYIIRFSSPAPAIGDSTVLIGIPLGGFLRMVQSVTIDTVNTDTVFTMQTTQANLDDITEYGAYSFGDFFNLDTTLSPAKNGGYHRLDRLPTRQELQSNAKFKNGGIHYYIIGEKTYMPKGVSVSSGSSKSGPPLVNFKFETVEIVDTMGVKIMLNGQYTYSPNFVIDRKKGWLGGTDYFLLGTSNSKEDISIGLKVDINATIKLLDDTFTVYKKTVYYLLIIGGVPVVLDVEFALRGMAGAEAGLMMTASPYFQQTNFSSNYVEYKNGSWNTVSNTENQTKFDNPAEVTGGLKQTFEIGPELSFNIYSVVGPYLSAKLGEELLLCASLTSPPMDWSAKMDIWGLGKLGVKGSIFGKEFINFYTAWTTDTFNYTFPDSLEITMGNRMGYSLASSPEERKIPVQVKVHSNQGITLPMAKVVFQPESTCSVGDSSQGSIFVTYADAKGIANATWIPGNTPESRLKVYIMNCSGKHIKNSPLEFIAYADTADACFGSNLSASLLFFGDTLSVQAKLGHPPYFYRLDSNSFTSSAPKILPEADSMYTFTVRDSLECKTTITFTTPNPCDKVSISVNYIVSGDTSFTFSAKGGTPPYLFSLNPDSLFSSNNTFTDLQWGFHRVYAKDSLGCIGFVEIGEEAVQICNQIWMKHNLDVGVGNNVIPRADYCGYGNTNPNSIWYGYCYEYYEKEHPEYGRLYDWESALIACPDGWHLPSLNEWQQLIICLGGPEVAGGKLKSTNTGNQISIGTGSFDNPDGHPFWYAPNTGATNQSGFAALPGGYHTNMFGNVGRAAYFWTSSQRGLNEAYWIGMNRMEAAAYPSFATISNITHRSKFSVRCIKDD